MFRSGWTAAAGALLLAACANEGAPALIVSSHQPSHLPRDRGYVACATALYRAYPNRVLWLRQGYAMRDLEEENLREFHLDARLRDHGATEHARFICTTSRFGKMDVLGFHRVDPALLQILTDR